MAARPRTVDILLAGVCFALTVFGPTGGRHGPGADDPRAVLLAGALVGVAALLVRRRSPVAAWAVAMTVTAALMLLVDGPTAAITYTAVGLYTVASLRGISWALITYSLTAIGYLALELVLDGRIDERALVPLSLLGVATAVGVTIATQRAAVAAAEGRARDAELTRDSEAARRVTEERLRIARELHDVVAHHVSVVRVQAGVARHLLESDPAQARAALDLVRSASGTAVDELGAAVGLLRSEQFTPGRTEPPAAGLARLEDLLDNVRRSGLDLDVDLRGQQLPLEEICDLTAYRIVQECLTNALRHGTGSARLVVEHTSETVEIVVSNRIAGPASPRADDDLAVGTGNGLVGMRERAQLVGARLQAGPQGAPAGPEFVVHAVVPRRRR